MSFLEKSKLQCKLQQCEQNNAIFALYICFVNKPLKGSLAAIRNLSISTHWSCSTFNIYHESKQIFGMPTMQNGSKSRARNSTHIQICQLLVGSKGSALNCTYKPCSLLLLEQNRSYKSAVIHKTSTLMNNATVLF